MSQNKIRVEGRHTAQIKGQPIFVVDFGSPGIIRVDDKKHLDFWLEIHIGDVAKKLEESIPSKSLSQWIDSLVIWFEIGNGVTLSNEAVHNLLHTLVKTRKQITNGSH